MLASKAIDIVIKVDDVKSLQKDLQEDFVINSSLPSVAENMVLSCGRLRVVANAALITVKHINFEKEPEEEPVQNLAKKLAKDLQKLHLIIYNMAEKSLATTDTSAAPAVPEQVLPNVPKTKPAKNPMRIAAGKKLAEHSSLACEAKKNPC